MHDPILDHVLALAATQHGIVSTEQALALGASTRAIDRWTRAGRLVRAAPRVIAVPGAPAGSRHRAMAAVLDAGPGAVLSHHSAGAHWDLPGFRLEPHHIQAPRVGTRRRDKPHTLHLARRLRPEHVTELDSIPVVTPTRLPFDLAAHLHPDRLARVVDTLWSRRLTTGHLLHETFEQVAGRGWHGTRAMRDVLAVRGPGYRPPESRLEARVLALLTEAGIHGFERQVDLGDDRRWLARVDLVHPGRGVIVQVDGDRFHTALLDRAHDQAQDDALRAAGWVIVRLTEHEVWHQPSVVRSKVRAALRATT